MRDAALWMVILLASLFGLLRAGSFRASAATASQGQAALSAEAGPEIQQVKPNEVAAGGKATVVIEGRNFSREAYVTCSYAAARVLSTRWVGPTRVEATLVLGIAPDIDLPREEQLAVSNPDGLFAGVAFTIAAAKGEIRVSAADTPEIQQVEPRKAVVGSEAKFVIEARNLSPDAYISFGNPAVRIISTRRISPTKIEVRAALGKKAAAGTFFVGVANPSGAHRATAFEFVPAGPPEVTSVEPVRAPRGSRVKLKLSGRNFVMSSEISFSNPRLDRVTGFSRNGTEVTADIEVPHNAPLGKTTLFVKNPDGRKGEASFEVVEGAAPAAVAPLRTVPAAPGRAPTRPAVQAAGGAVVVPVRLLGEGEMDFMQAMMKMAAGLQADVGRGKVVKGRLEVSSQSVKYFDGNTLVFEEPASAVKTVEEITMMGQPTGSFRIVFASGKIYNFMGEGRGAAKNQACMVLKKALGK